MMTMGATLPSQLDCLCLNGKSQTTVIGGFSSKWRTKNLNQMKCSNKFIVKSELKTETSSKSILKNGDDEIEICRVINGMWQTSGGWGTINEKPAVNAMIDYFDAGFDTFDLADIYGPAEPLYGSFINEIRKTRGDESASKLRGLTKYVPPPQKMTRGVVEEAINRSRKRMDVNCLDMVQFHWWDYSNQGYLDALKHLTDLKEEGKIKTIGLTNFDTRRLQIIFENQIPVVSNQVQHSLVDMRPQKEMAKFCELTGIKLITYGTVLGGFFSEKYLNAKEPNSIFGPKLTTPSQKKYIQMIKAWGDWKLFQELLLLCEQISKKYNVSISNVAVKYILQQPYVGGSMVGVRFGLSEHILSNKKVFDFELTTEDFDSLSQVMVKGRDLFSIIGDCGDEYR